MEEEDRYTRITLRIPKELHARLSEASDRTSKSLNAEIVARLEQSFGDGTSALLLEMQRTRLEVRRGALENELRFIEARIDDFDDFSERLRGAGAEEKLIDEAEDHVTDARAERNQILYRLSEIQSELNKVIERSEAARQPDLFADASPTEAREAPSAGTVPFDDGKRTIQVEVRKKRIVLKQPPTPKRKS